MEIIIRCPNCGMELEAPDDLVGSRAMCPGCQQPFVVQAYDPANESLVADSPASSAVSTKESPSSEATKSNRKSTSTTSSVNETAPASSAAASRSTGGDAGDGSSSTSAAAGSTAGNTSGKPRFNGLDASLMAELGPDVKNAPSPACSAAPLTDFVPATNSPIRTDRPTRRERKVARLVTSGQEVSKLTLGADGQLPELVIKETAATEKRKTEEQESSPLMLIVALLVSVSMSMLMLFVPTESRSSKADVADSLAALQEHYIGNKQPLEPYQLLIRKALQAENKGDRRTAIAVYRQLLEMLYQERPNRNQGLTGPKLSTQEPNDRQLEAHLNTLLAR